MLIRDVNKSYVTTGLFDRLANWIDDDIVKTDENTPFNELCAKLGKPKAQIERN